MGKTIIIGVGNPILGDDGIGIHVTRELQKIIDDPMVTITEAYTGGMNLLDMMIGYDKAIIVDAMVSPNNIGEVKRLELEELPPTGSSNPHNISLMEAILLARKLGEDNIPRSIIIIAVMIPRPIEFREELSENVAAAIPRAVAAAIEEIRR